MPLRFGPLAPKKSNKKIWCSCPINGRFTYNVGDDDGNQGENGDEDEDDDDDQGEKIMGKRKGARQEKKR